jgi:hypothetical protein
LELAYEEAGTRIVAEVSLADFNRYKVYLIEKS